MTLNSIILSIIIGGLIGIAYALSFLINKTRMLCQIDDKMTQPSFKNKLTKIIFSITRLAILSILWFYMMRLPSVDFGVIMLSFFISFWVVIIKKKSKITEF